MVKDRTVPDSTLDLGHHQAGPGNYYVAVWTCASSTPVRTRSASMACRTMLTVTAHLRRPG